MIIENTRKATRNELIQRINELQEKLQKNKDKIKEKMEELDNQQRQFIEDRTNKHNDGEIIYARDILKELLEEL